MRIIHTSDWHLGISSGAVSRGPDHTLVLDWLIERLGQGDVDALIVAGDIFDSMQPSAEAQAQYYSFLQRARGTGVTQIIVVGGNHDSASRLEAPADVLGLLSITVVGGLRGDNNEQGARCVVPLRNRDGSVGAVLLAVPYVHEFRLGVRTTDLDQAAVRARFEERFSLLYRQLADQAEAAFPGAPLIATGHLTIGPANRDDYPQEIHQVGQIDGLPPTVFDPRIRYVALGHIHRSYPVDGHRAWYSGTPLALSITEAQTPRRMLQVDVDNGGVKVQPLTVPTPRALLELRGPAAQVVAAISSLVWTEALPPLLYVDIQVDGPDPTLAQQMRDALSAHPVDRRPQLVQLRETLASSVARPQEAAPDLTTMSPLQVFQRLLDASGVAAAAPLLAAFASVEALDHDTLQAWLDRLASA
jgi:DNA repair protein SbcD/Mre11